MDRTNTSGGLTVGNQTPPRRDWKQGIRPALILSLVLGVVAAVVATFAASGGTAKGLDLRMGAIAFLIAFIAGLVVISLLMMVSKENADYLSEGSGVNRSSQISDADLAKRQAERRAGGAQAGAAGAAGDAVPDAASAATSDAGASGDDGKGDAGKGDDGLGDDGTDSGEASDDGTAPRA